MNNKYFGLFTLKIREFGLFMDYNRGMFSFANQMPTSIHRFSVYFLQYLPEIAVNTLSVRHNRPVFYSENNK